MRVLRIFFRLLFILFAVLGGTMVALALTVFIAWRLLPAKSVPAKTLLTFDLGDGIVEREPGDIFDRLAQGDAVPLRTITVALEAAGRDDRVKGLLLRLGTGEVGLGQVQELREAIRAFHARSKSIWCFAEDFGEGGNGTLRYDLAAGCDEIWMQPSGEVGLTGFTLETPFVKETLDKLGIRAEMDHREDYKGAVNTLTSAAMPAPQRENMQRLVDSWLAQVTADIGEGRKMAASDVQGLVDRGPFLANEAMALKLIDKLGYRDQADAAAKKQAGTTETMSLADYAEALPEPPSNAPRIALIYGLGDIELGDDEGSGLLGRVAMRSSPMRKALSDAINDADIKAIVLRIDSPGGSYVASDTIWREVQRAREKNKPLFVSMGNVAASGGYMIAAPARGIVADPGTLTGSIGVFGGKIVTRGLWDMAGVHWDGVKAGANADIGSPNTPFSPAGWKYLEASLDAVYADFLTRVAEGRKLSADVTRSAAKGQIWTGADARERGLVDELGGLATAIRLARNAAGVPADAVVRIQQFPAPESGLSLALRHLLEASLVKAGLGPTLSRLSYRLGDIAALLDGADAGSTTLRLPPLRQR
jgi:protease IV